MQTTTDEIKKYLNKGYLDLVMDGKLDPMRLELSVKPNFNTALWAFQPPHRIAVGNKILEGSKCRNVAEEEYLTNSFLNHEVAHSRFTERDFKATNTALKTHGLKFNDLNIFEDARIEHLWREETGRAFRWAAFEPPVMQTGPMGTLAAIIHNDGSIDEIIDAAWKGRVCEYYYPMIIAASSTGALIPLLIEWREEFGEEGMCEPQTESQPGGESQSCAGEGEIAPGGRPKNLQPDMNGAHQLSCSASDMELYFEDCKMVTTGVPSGPKEEPVDPSTVRIAEASKGKLLGNYMDHLDAELADALAPQFARLFRVKKGVTPSATPNKRLNVRSLIRGTYDAPFMKKTELRPGCKRVTLIVDVSGSMSGRAIEGMRVIVAIFSRLAKMGHVNGEVILSGVKGSSCRWETFRLPLPDSIIQKIDANYDAEGIDATIKGNLATLKKSDWIFCLTDGRITDDPIDTKLLASLGISITGIYIGDEKHCNLGAWFSKGIARKTVKGVADELLRKLK